MNPETATRQELIELNVGQAKLIAELRARLAWIEERVSVLEGETVPSGESEPGVSAPEWVERNRPKKGTEPRKKRARGYGRKRSTPTQKIVHALESCVECGSRLRGGSVRRTREV